ncbi:hypothetical protein, partial [Streptomyces sp. NPDC056983]|uniref:hypothetical protein n=1 Tax=Streptomyces sp. NPDC056983 TaxID=3345987 RepID=UPI0036284054
MPPAAPASATAPDVTAREPAAGWSEPSSVTAAVVMPRANAAAAIAKTAAMRGIRGLFMVPADPGA